MRSLRSVIIQSGLITVLMFSLFACNSEAQKSDSDIPDYSSMEQEEAVEKAVFKGLDDQLVSIDQFEGKVVMLDFWETWCKPCLNSFPTLDKLVQEYPDDFAILAVTPGFMDSKADAKNFADKHDYKFTYVMDAGLSSKLAIQSIPFKVFVDAQGNYISSKVGSYGPKKDYEEIKEIIEKHSK